MKRFYRLRIDRNALLSSLGYLNGKIPRDVRRTIHDHPIQSRNYDVNTKQWFYTTIFHAAVEIYPTPHRWHNATPGHPLGLETLRRHKSSAHRIFVQCPGCREDIPFGRFHQHAGTGACRAAIYRTLGLSADTPPAIAHDKALDMDRPDLAMLIGD